MNANVDLSKLCTPDPELRFAVVLRQFNDPSSIEVISYVFPMFAMSNNSTLLKTGFSSKEEATEWMENYKRDPSICNIREDLINGVRCLSKVLNATEDSNTYCIEQDDFNDPSTAHVVSTIAALVAPVINNKFLFTKFKTKKEAEDWVESYKKDPSIWDKWNK